MLFIIRWIRAFQQNKLDQLLLWSLHCLNGRCVRIAGLANEGILNKKCYLKFLIMRVLYKTYETIEPISHRLAQIPRNRINNIRLVILGEFAYISNIFFFCSTYCWLIDYWLGNETKLVQTFCNGIFIPRKEQIRTLCPRNSEAVGLLLECPVPHEYLYKKNI